MEGTIKTFDPIRKFGSIDYDGGKTIFVHISAFKAFVKANEINALVGKPVTFAIGEYNGRPTAKDVEVTEPTAPRIEAETAEESDDLTELVPYDEQTRLDRKAKRNEQTRLDRKTKCQKRSISECYIGKRKDKEGRRERQKKLIKAFNDAFGDCDE